MTTMILPEGHMSFADTCTRFLSLHERALWRPQTMSDEDYEVYGALMNRLAAAFMWSEIRGTDLVAETMTSAPRWAEMVVNHISRMPLDVRTAVLDATRDYPW